ncbi:hypothetical protein QBC41DRAFT_59937 [Cercophora samala]|uniref:Uncharacterized protein n=1 Tax=Cercophora samala TaxID=330535 RepID=A0AA39ZHJ3_9PEZI|nr:hypothetical protein QBC41DRAFT_59937 [Cercophora samala]
MANLIELSRQSPSSLSPWEPSVLLQLWNPDAQGWSCLGWTQADRRCRRALSQARRDAIMRILPDLSLSDSKNADLETKFLSELSYECLCQDHGDDETAQALVEQWKTAFQKARFQYQKREATPSKAPLSRPSANRNTQLRSPLLSSGESEGKAVVSPENHPKSPTIIKKESFVEQTVECPTLAERKSPFSVSSPTESTESSRNSTSIKTSSTMSAKKDTSKLDFLRLFPGSASRSASPPTERTPQKFDFSAPFTVTTPTKSPETSKSTPSFDFSQLFQTPGSNKPTVNPQKGTPAPSSFFRFDQSITPGTSSTGGRSYSSVQSRSSHGKNSPSFVFSSSSTPSRPPVHNKQELSNVPDCVEAFEQRQKLESQRQWLRNLRESGVDKVLMETESDISGLGESIKKLRLQLQKGGSPTLTHKEAEEVDERSHADLKCEDGGSGQGGGIKKEGGEAGGMFDFSCQTPKTAGPGLGAGGQSKFDFVFSSGEGPK